MFAAPSPHARSAGDKWHPGTSPWSWAGGALRRPTAAGCAAEEVSGSKIPNPVDSCQLLPSHCPQTHLMAHSVGH